MDCRYCEQLDINTIERGAACKFGLRPETCGRFKLAECYKVLVEEEAKSGCEYGTYCDGEDKVFYPTAGLRSRSLE